MALNDGCSIVSCNFDVFVQGGKPYLSTPPSWPEVQKDLNFKWLTETAGTNDKDVHVHLGQCIQANLLKLLQAEHTMLSA